MNKKKIRLLIGVCILGISLPVTVIAETTSRRANIKSTGNINFQNGEVYMSSSDLIYLADEIDHLENTYKTAAVDALNQIGTFFLNDGSTVNYMEQNEADTEEEKAALSFGNIIEGIRNSQSVACLAGTGCTDKEGNLLYYETEEAQTNKDIFSLTTTDTGFPAYYRAVNADNLSAGTAAWVNGTLIKGNGSDNKFYYAQGWLDGKQDVVDNLDITYTYHAHSGNEWEGSGCYTNTLYHSHDDDCYHVCTGTMFATETGVEQSNGSWKAATKCNRCNKTAYDIGGIQHVVGQELGKCGKKTLKCGLSDTTIMGYELGCGKTEDTIESATIIY